MYASFATKNAKIEPVPVVSVTRQAKAKVPTLPTNLLYLASNIIHKYKATTAIKPLYKNTFHAKIDLKLKVVIATMRRSGLPRSSTKTINPPVNKLIAKSAESLPSGLYIFILKTEEIEAIFKTPDAAIIKKIANTCGKPQTIWLFIPVSQCPSCSSVTNE